MTHQQTYSYPPTDPPSDDQPDDDQPDRVTSDPVPVPPPSAEDRDDNDTTAAADAPAEDVTDRVPDEALDDQGTFEDPVLSEERTDPDDLTAVTPGQDEDAVADSDRDEPEFHEPAPQPTAFGAATVGGAAAAAAMAGPSRDVTDERDADERDVTDERTGFADERDVTDERTGFADERDVTDERTGFADERDASGVGAATDLGDVTDERDRTDERAAEPEFSEPAATAVPAEDEPALDGEPRPEMLPGDVPAEPVTALWGDDTAQSFRDRWRDVQLRFVDDPQGAAREAQSLVDDAVQSLTTALTSQRDELGGWTSTDGNDTEQFRVVVRQYRDFLDRLLGL